MCLYIRETNDSNHQGMRGRNHGFLVIIRHSTREAVECCLKVDLDYLQMDIANSGATILKNKEK